MARHALSRELIESVASEEGARLGVPLVAVLGASHARAPVTARKRSWVRLAATFPIVRIADVWGCHRRGIQRALAEARQ